MNLFEIPENKKIRVIVDTDAACEADDPFAVAHALLSPKLIVRGILAEHFAEPGSMEKSYEEIRTILSAMDREVPVLILRIAGDLEMSPCMSTNLPALSEVDMISEILLASFKLPLSFTVPMVTMKSVAMNASGEMPRSCTTLS